MTKTTTANYKDFSLVDGGVIYAATSIFRRGKNKSLGLPKTALAMIFFTWGVMCILAIIDGTLNDTDQTISFFEDFMIHVRFLFVLPFLILIDNVVDKAFVGYIQDVDKLIPNDEQPKFDKFIKFINRLTDSYIPEITILIGVYCYIIFNWHDLSIFNSGRNYLGTGSQLNAAGWYYTIICSPIFQLLVIRWVWRWLIWIYSVIKVSRFSIQTDPLHADKMSGLEFLNITPLALSYLLVAPSALLSAYIGVDIVYKGTVLTDFILPISAYVFLLPIVLYAPLLAFVPHLIKTKTYGIQNFGSIIREHNKSYREAWIDRTKKKDEPLLGSMDNSSLADINGSYSPVMSQQLVPINFKMLLISFTLNLLPYLPLIFTYYSPIQLFEDLVKSIVS